jgi:hypothetical protein
MRVLTCRNCGFVNESHVSSWASQRFLCTECGTPIEQGKAPQGAIPGSSSPKVGLSLIEGKGMGVVALVGIKKDDLIERCPVMVLGPGVDPEIQAFPYEDGSSPFHLRHLLLPWVTDSNRCIAFGYGTFYNHSSVESSNASYVPYVEPNSNRRFIDFYAKREIKKGEEVTQTYAPRRYLWFSPKE